MWYHKLLSENFRGGVKYIDYPIYQNRGMTAAPPAPHGSRAPVMNFVGCKIGPTQTYLYFEELEADAIQNLTAPASLLWTNFYILTVELTQKLFIL